jgi:beta-lactamase superfamily II metal-dependent hydrolase
MTLSPRLKPEAYFAPVSNNKIWLLVWKAKVTKCQTGQSWIWDGVLFEILSPHNKYKLTGNNASCVLKVSNKKHGILLTGDIEKETERISVISKFCKILFKPPM